MRLRKNGRRRLWTGLAVTGLGLGCSDPEAPGVDPLNPGEFLVSNPVPALEPPAMLALGSAHAGPTVVYVSLPPATIPAGFSASIRDLRTGDSVIAGIVNGGFDPVPLPASEGDTLVISVRKLGDPGSEPYRLLVASAKRPRVVRTSPPKHKRDVPLNAIVVIVFSEPLDPATVNPGSVQLQRGTEPVSGTIRFADPARLRVEFRPDSLLNPLTEYQLVATTAIRNLSGLALDSLYTVPFTTGSTAPSAALVFATVSVGLSHTCGVTTDRVAYCWGDNAGGALGDGTTASSMTPVAVAGGLTFDRVSAGSSKTCGITTGGALYCWGHGQIGSLFFTGGSDTPVRVPVAGRVFTSLHLGYFHACAVTTAGAAYCWGENGMGEVGDGSITPRQTPVPVAGGLAFERVSAGVYSTCGITTAGAGYCWGNNMLGGLGTGTDAGPQECYPGIPFHPCSMTPAAVTGGLTFRQVEAGVYSGCGLTTSGTTYCWGSNLNDHLGFGTITGPGQCHWDESYVIGCVLAPTPVPQVPSLVTVSSSDGYSCGLTSGGIAYCWGGYPAAFRDLTTSTAPVAVPGGLTFAQLATGAYATCGVTNEGVAYCWGYNVEGHLGNGTTESSYVPVKVAGQP